MSASPAPGLILALAAALVWGALASACTGGDKEVILGTTTTVQDPGLLDALVKAFEESTDYHLKPVVGGSGQTLETARRGEFDVIMTHSPKDEEQFVAAGEGLEPQKVMQNYFLVAGPKDDPAGVKGSSSLGEAFRRIAFTGEKFISRGDNSGTHVRELSVWKDLGIDPKGQSWYQESAVGQGQNILVASDKGAYTLADSATFISFRDRVSLVDFVTDRDSPNIYTVMLINPQKHSNVNAGGARAFRDWIIGSDGQRLIGEFGREQYGQSLFVPVAGK